MSKLVSKLHHVKNLDKKCPYYRLVPKDLVENIRFREKILLDAKKDKKVREDLWRMCKRDILFWFGAFAWTLDPRLPAKIRKIPFIPYGFQEFCILDLLDSIEEGTSRAIQKCRDMGLSWMCLGVAYHQWQFSEHFRAGFSSRNEKLVVNSLDEDAVFTRLAFIKNNQPGWMVPKHTDLEGRWKNHEQGGTLSGEATTGNMFRAGRFTVAILDEYAHFTPTMASDADKASANVTEVRWFNSTPNGTANEFYRKCHPKKNDPFAPVVRRYQWTEHPEHVKGLYRSDEGRLTIIDKSYKWPKDYEFILDGKLRSAWYDKKSAELGHDSAKIAEELDGDFTGSGRPVFDYAQLKEIADKTARPPLRTGMLMVPDKDLAEPGEFLDEHNGPFRLWVNLDYQGGIEPWRRCVVGIDVSKGRNASNDAICVWDRDTKEKLAQYVDCQFGDYMLAPLAVATAKLFNNAQMIWEQDGGVTFGKHVIDLGYTNFYMKRSRPDALNGGKATDSPGWKSSTFYKEQALKEYVHSLREGRAFNRDAESIMECAKFKYSDSGGVIHEEAEDKWKGRARANHGDVVIGDMLAWLLIGTYGRTRITEEKAVEGKSRFNALNHPDPPPGTPAYRYQKWRDGQKKADWDETFASSSAVF